MEKENVVVDNLNTTEEVVLDTTEEITDPEETVETIDEVNFKLAKAEELANNYKIRAEKAERLAKGTAPKVETKQNISISDAVVLLKANVPEDDMDMVQNYAIGLGLTIAQALKTTGLKAELAEKEEIRKTASVANTGNVRRGVQKVSVETLMAKADKGEMPESDEDLITLLRARKGLK